MAVKRTRDRSPPVRQIPMVPFKLPLWRKKQIASKFHRKDKVIHQAVSQMEKAMRGAIDQILDHYLKTGHYPEPTLNGMHTAADEFYRSVIAEGFYAARDEKEEQAGKKRLAKGPPNLPKGMKSLDHVFNNHKYWSKVMKRSEKLSQKLRRQYLQKIQKKFQEIIPLLDQGIASPQEVKAKMMEAWNASKPRVETIFRTEATNYFAKTQVAFYEKDPEIIGFMFDSVRDTSRTDICRSRHGMIYRPGTKLLKDNTPALHYNCRSHLIALANTPYNRTLLEDPSRDPEKRSVAPLPKAWRK